TDPVNYDVYSFPTPGAMNFYVYWPEQRDGFGDHFFPNGEILPYTYMKRNWGAGFVSRPHFIPELDRWYCFEVRVRMNTVNADGTTKNDGILTSWVDGQM